jgi:phage tail-like protein
MTRTDPLLGFNFQVSLLDSATTVGNLISTTLSVLGASPNAGFSECSGLDGTIDTEDYEEGGNNGYVHRFRKHIRWQNVVLKRGVVADDTLWDWFYSYAKGQGRRRNGLITLLNEAGERQKTWGFREGLPVRLVGPSMNAMQSAVAIESLEIAHHGLYQLPGGDGIAGAAASALNAIL